MIEFECPECGGRVRSPDVLLGGTDRCPHCRNAVLVHDLFGGVDPPNGEGVAMIRHGCDKCWGQIESPAYLAGEKDTCPKCGAEVFVPEDENDNRFVTRRQYELAKERLRQGGVPSGTSQSALGTLGGGDMIGQRTERGRSILIVGGLAVVCIAVAYFWRYATESSSPPQANGPPEAARPAYTQPNGKVDPLAEVTKEGQLVPCADGTLYLLPGQFSSSNTLYWLARDTAARVSFPDANELGAADDLDDVLYFRTKALPDAFGGVYIQGRTHLWYVKDGHPTQVRLVEDTKGTTQPSAVTRNSLYWACRLLDQQAQEKAREEARQEGRVEGLKQGLEEGRMGAER